MAEARPLNAFREAFKIESVAPASKKFESRCLEIFDSLRALIFAAWPKD